MCPHLPLQMLILSMFPKVLMKFSLLETMILKFSLRWSIMLPEKKEAQIFVGKGSQSAEPIMENTVSRSIVVDNNTNIKDKLNDIFPIGPSV